LANNLDPNDPTIAYEDPDRDGLTNLLEYQSGTDPNKPDTDGDGLNDGDEVNKYHTSPLLTDTDGDLIPDGVEVTTGTNPLDRTSYDLKSATATSTVTPPSFTLQTSVANPVMSIQLAWSVKLIDGKTTLDLTADPRTHYTSSDLTICSFQVQPGQVFSGNPGSCVITLSQNTLSTTASGTVTYFTPVEISTLTVNGAVAVDVSGNFAYVATGNSGLAVVDITDRTHPLLRGTLGGLGNAQGVRASGQYVFLVDANGFLRIVQAQNPAAPVLIASLAITGAPTALALRSGLAAVAAGTGGVSLVNVADIMNPVLVSKFTVPASALGVDFDPQSGLAAVAMGTGGLQLADISNPSSPKLRGSLPGGDVRRVLVRFPAVLLADVQRSVTAVNVTNPDQPVLAVSIPPNLGGAPVEIAAFGNIAITADTSFGRAVPIIGIANPLNPATLTYWNLQSAGFSSGVAIDSSFGYLIIPNTLRILKYQNIVDTFGKPPVISIISPVPGAPLIQGQTVTFAANATDDVAVASVSLLVNGKLISTVATPPYQANYTVPLNATALTFGATAGDYGNNTGVAADVSVQVIPDPLTTVTGVVVDNAQPVGGATVTVGSLGTQTTANGAFTLTGVPTISGNIIAMATATINGAVMAGLSTPVPPVRGGTTNVGTITLSPIPVITSLTPKSVLANTTVTLTVSGTNLSGSTFAFSPSTNMNITGSSIAPSGTSATLTVNVLAASGRFVLIATNVAGPSDPTVKLGFIEGTAVFNTLTVPGADPAADTDTDGLPDGYELVLGSDPLNADTDGDLYSDAAEVASISDPLNPACTPLNCRVSGERDTFPTSVSNIGFTSSMPGESDSIIASTLNIGATSSSALESVSLLFSTLNTGATTKVLQEADSLLASVLANFSTNNIPFEADTIPFSVCNTLGSCADYGPLMKAPRRARDITTVTTNRPGSDGLAAGPADGRFFGVLSVTPSGGAGRVSLRAPVAVNFSAPLDIASINAANFALIADGKALDAEIRYSTDFRTVMLRLPLPPDSRILIQLSNQIKDLWGRRLEAFESDFHTVGQSEAPPPVIAQSPPFGAVGWPTDSSTIRLYVASPLNMDQASAALHVTQDGDPVSGSVQVSERGRLLEFIPSQALRPGAVIKIALSGIGSGSAPRSDYEGVFTTASAPSDVTEMTRAIPGQAIGSARNSVIEIEYNRPLDPNLISASNSFVIGDATSEPVPTRISLRGDRIVRLVPAEPLASNAEYSVNIASVLDDSGLATNAIQQHFSTGAEASFGSPRLQSSTPADGATDVEATTELRLIFDRLLNPLSLSTDTVWLTEDGVRVSRSIAVASDGREIVLTPVAPLKPGSLVQVNVVGVEDVSGNSVPLSTIRFRIGGRQGLLAAGTVNKKASLRATRASGWRRTIQFWIRRSNP
ncbi:MAG: hypothetical protein C5B51_02665, partial [Terriglobia bacterium]